MGREVGREYRLAENGERDLERGRESAKQPAAKMFMWHPCYYICIPNQTKERYDWIWLGRSLCLLAVEKFKLMSISPRKIFVEN